jgi:hypothetical protein
MLYLVKMREIEERFSPFLGPDRMFLRIRRANGTMDAKAGSAERPRRGLPPFRPPVECPHRAANPLFSMSVV